MSPAPPARPRRARRRAPAHRASAAATLLAAVFGSYVVEAAAQRTPEEALQAAKTLREDTDRLSNAAKLSFSPNCAAKKQCNKPLEERDADLHAAPPEAPKGHLKPLGHPDFDGSWAGEVERVEEMGPATFWKEYWPTKPFVLKGFGKKSLAYVKWQDDNYILESFGKFKAKTEPKNEDRLTDYCGQKKFGQQIKCGRDIIPYTESYMSIAKFLPRYKDPSFDKYIITQMPDIMGKDFTVPTFHACGRREPEDPGPPVGGRWMTQMYENNFWLSHNGGNNFSTSVIHYDMNHQIMCQFSGTKEWIMWDLQKDHEKIPMWSGYYDPERHRSQGSDDSPIDGERVDLLRWPKFAEARWSNATLEPGDCLFTPALSLHYVRSRGRNAAAMTMFQTEERYDPKCGGEASKVRPLPLSAYDVMWSFPEEEENLLGFNVVKMGYPNWKKMMLRPLAQEARKAGGRLGRKAFLKHMGRLAKEVGVRKDQVKLRAKAAFKAMDPDGDGELETSRLWSKELRLLFKDLAVSMEGGRPEQEMDVEVDRFDLKGNVKKRNLEL